MIFSGGLLTFPYKGSTMEEKRGRFVTDRRRIKLNELEGMIPLFTGRPKRERAISQDDLTNLVIALHTSKTLEEFIERI
jgi:hypothetical protein